MVKNELICNKTHLSNGQYHCSYWEKTLETLIAVSGGLIDVGTVYQAGLEIERETGLGRSVLITSCDWDEESERFYIRYDS